VSYASFEPSIFAKRLLPMACGMSIVYVAKAIRAAFVIAVGKRTFGFREEHIKCGPLHYIHRKTFKSLALQLGVLRHRYVLF
jgi:hypothetical protein